MCPSWIVWPAVWSCDGDIWSLDIPKYPHYTYNLMRDKVWGLGGEIDGWMVCNSGSIDIPRIVRESTDETSMTKCSVKVWLADPGRVVYQFHETAPT